MSKEKIYRYVFLIYLFLSMVLIGWQFWAFVTIYGSAQENLIPVRLDVFMQSLPAFLIPGMIIILICGTVLFIARRPFDLLNITFFKYHYISLCIYFILLLLDYILFRASCHYNIMELIITIFGLMAVYAGGMAHLKSDLVIYHHPTLMGSQVVHTALAGLAAFLLMSPLSEYAAFQPGWFLALIFLDMFIVLGHFRFLSAAGSETRLIARQLLGKYIFLFGARLIVGIFIPLVLVIYSIFSDRIELSGAAALVLIGIFLQRAIFIIVIDHREI
jgi:hypothetical protein